MANQPCPAKLDMLEHDFSSYILIDYQLCHASYVMPVMSCQLCHAIYFMLPKLYKIDKGCTGQRLLRLEGCSSPDSYANWLEIRVIMVFEFYELGIIVDLLAGSFIICKVPLNGLLQDPTLQLSHYRNWTEQTVLYCTVLHAVLQDCDCDCLDFRL